MSAPDALVAGAMFPHAAPLHPRPDSVQLTPLFAESLATVAVKSCVLVTGTVAVVAESVTAIGGAGATIVIVAAADLLVSATEVTVSVTVAALGAVGGAV